MIPGVELIGASSGNFGRYVTGAVSVSQQKGDTQPFRMDFYYADAGMISLSGLSLIAGTSYANEPATEEREIIINEKASVALGYKTPFDAVGQVVYIEDTVQVSITGIVKDFYNAGVGNAVRPLMLRQKEGKQNVMNVLVSGKSNRRQLETNIGEAWKKLYPDKAFSYQWLREEHDRGHAEAGSVSLLAFLAFMTIAIACLGLLGLIVYTVETRRKEISIRKIIGASVYHLTYLLSSGFAKLLLLAGCIALPTGYILSELFLLNFANRITVGVPMLLSSFVLLLVIGLVMIGSQTIKAATENPVKHLRSE
jgi:putative ABC transport system permease protein